MYTVRYTEKSNLQPCLDLEPVSGSSHFLSIGSLFVETGGCSSVFCVGLWMEQAWGEFQSTLCMCVCICALLCSTLSLSKFRLAHGCINQCSIVQDLVCVCSILPWEYES